MKYARWLPLLCLAACQLSQPEGAYEPDDLELRADNAEAGMPSEEPQDDPWADAAVSSEAGPDSETPSQKLQRELAGAYWVRVDSYSVDRSTLTGEVESHVTTFLVARLAVVEGGLKMVDRQCAQSFDQKGKATTTIDPREQRSYKYAQRNVRVDAERGTWSTERGPYAVGWDYDFATMPDRDPPASDGDSLLVDNDGQGNGVNVTVASSGLTCKVRVVQKIDWLFSGQLQGGQIQRGTVDDNGSKQQQLYQDIVCPKTEPVRSGPNTVRFLRRDSVDLASCPSVSEFMGQLSAP